MTVLLDLKLPARRAAIAAKVVDAVTSSPVERATATIVSGPAAFDRWLALRSRSREALAGERPDRERTAADGCFRFIDLPDGDYTLSLHAPGFGAAKQSFSVKRDAQGNIPVTIATVALPPTGARGLVKAEGSAAALPLARVRLVDSGEVAYCDASGAFYLGRVQKGARRVAISAAGFRPATVGASVTEGQVVDLGTISLKPAGG